MKRIRTMSERAKRVMYPALVVVFVTFFSFLVHMLILGTSAFPGGGKLVEGRYLVKDHGKTFEMTCAQYWFSYIHGVVLVAVFVLTALLVVRFYYTGDLRDEHRDD